MAGKYNSNNHVPYAEQRVGVAIVRNGFVVSGQCSGWEIFVGDDRDGDSGGYYIYLKKIDCDGFDYWIEHEAGL